MLCKKCGFQLSNNDLFCPSCGTPVSFQNSNNGFLGVNNGETEKIDISPISQSVPPVTNANPQPVINNSYQSVPPVTNANPQPTINNSYQPGPRPYVNNQSTYNQPKSNNTILIVLAVIIILGLGGFFAFRFLNLSFTANTGSDSTISSSTYKVMYENYELSIPDNLKYDIDSDGTLAIYDKESTWVAYIIVANTSYSAAQSRMSTISDFYISKGYTAAAAKEQTLNGVQFITAEVAKDGYNHIVAYTKANSMNVFGIDAISEDNTFNYSILTNISSILKSTTYISSTNNTLFSNEKADFFDINSFNE